jgi:N-acetylglucosaminyldiphosphoundecaprenol N-acetyl-beta-D-mannosaminyltransferase
MLSGMQISERARSDLMRVNVFGVETTPLRFDDAIRTLEQWALDASGRRYVSTCPVYTLMMCREHPDVMRAVNRADMVAADGMPVVWMQRKLGASFAERVYGPDVMQTLCTSGDSSIRHYFWGGLPGVPEKLADTLRAQNPHIQIAGMHSPPIRPAESTPDPEVVERINSAGASIVWVGLGSPKQDRWMATYRPVLDVPLLIAVGAAFDMLAGIKSQAPRWMQRTGLEWLFRLQQEPKRLWKRYLVYNPRFIWLVLGHLWSHRRS